jgi:putative FmdB family regulatory protein
MPTYDYKCPKCGATKEVIKHYQECKSEEICQECHIAMTRLYNALRSDQIRVRPW